MKYCTHCRLPVDGNRCPRCGAERLGEIQPGDYCLLVEKEEMWTNLLRDILSDNCIPSLGLPVFGAGLTLRTGRPERLRLYVPYESLEQARALMEEVFPGQN